MFSLSPVSDAAALGRAHAVVRRGRDIADGADLETGGGQRADGGLTTGTRALDEDVDLAHAVLHGTTRGSLGSHLRGERGGLARALEADLAGGGPGDHGTGGVGDGNDGVVERALDVSVPVGNVLLLLAAHLLGARSRTALGRHEADLLHLLAMKSGKWSGSFGNGSRGCSPPGAGPDGGRAGPTCRPSSCRPRCAWGPCGCARWSSCAGRARGARGGAGDPRSCRSPPCGGCQRRPRGGGHPPPCSCRRGSRAA